MSGHGIEEGAAALERINATARAILAAAPARPQVGLILGSGLGAFAEGLEGAVRLPYGEIPGFLAPTVPGHKGELVLGRAGGVDVAVMSGRFHYYEHGDMELVAFPIRVMRQLGVRCLLVTNSAGGIDPSFRPGDLMLIEDHLNLTGQSPLLGPNLDFFGPRFPDMSYAYTPEVRAAIEAAAAQRGVKLQRGVYVGLTGPTYETPAEVRMLRTLGGAAVGMSTVAEVIVANHAGMLVGGISCISNQAAGLTEDRLSHDEIKEAADRARDSFVGLLHGTLEELIRAGVDLSPLPGALEAPLR